MEKLNSLNLNHSQNNDFRDDKIQNFCWDERMSFLIKVNTYSVLEVKRYIAVFMWNNLRVDNKLINLKESKGIVKWQHLLTHSLDQ